MEKDYFYEEMNSRKRVYKEDAFNYVAEKLGITIKPVGVAGSWTQDQIIFMDDLENWYFSGNWVKYEEGEEGYNDDNIEYDTKLDCEDDF